MAFLAWALMLSAATIGMLVVPLGLSGQFLLPAAAAFWLVLPVDPAVAPFTGGQVIGMAVVALLAEVAEAISGVVGGKKAGGSRRAAWWAFFGGLGGAVLGTFTIPLPIVGSLLGTLLGTFLGAYLAEHSLERPRDHSARVGTGALIGRIIGILVKGSVSVGMFAYALLVLLDLV
jgi:hypothetical protein